MRTRMAVERPDAPKIAITPRRLCWLCAIFLFVGYLAGIWIAVGNPYIGLSITLAGFVYLATVHRAAKDSATPNQFQPPEDE